MAHPPCQSDGGGVHTAHLANQMKPAVRRYRRAPIRRCATPGYLCPVLQIQRSGRTTQGRMLQAASQANHKVRGQGSDSRGQRAGVRQQGSEGRGQTGTREGAQRSGGEDTEAHTRLVIRAIFHTPPHSGLATLRHPVGDLESRVRSASHVIYLFFSIQLIVENKGGVWMEVSGIRGGL